MAQRTITEHTSDLSGTKIKSDSPTVQFGIDGDQYEIDLTDAEQRKLRELCATYIAEGRKISAGRTAGKRAAGKRAAGTRAASDAAQMRTWARENGYEVPERGRIPARIRQAYTTR